MGDHPGTLPLKRGLKTGAEYVNVDHQQCYFSGFPICSLISPLIVPPISPLFPPFLSPLFYPLFSPLFSSHFPLLLLIFPLIFPLLFSLFSPLCSPPLFSVILYFPLFPCDFSRSDSPGPISKASVGFGVLHRCCDGLRSNSSFAGAVWTCVSS